MIHLFWDGRIDERKKEELEKHLATCKRCKEKLALLESIERGAKEIKIEEPSQKYWDTFSSRVRERIVAQREEAFSIKLKKLFENIFTFSPLKIRIAAGVVSVVLVFIVGKLYFQYQRREIVPSKPEVESAAKPSPSAPGTTKGISPSVESKEALASRIAPREEIPLISVLEEKARKKEEVIPSPGELKKPAVPQIKPGEKTTTEMVELKQETLSPEASATGAGAEEKGKVSEEMAPAEQKAKDIEKTPLMGEAKMEAKKAPLLVTDRAREGVSVLNYYAIQNEKILKLEEGDTLLQEDMLRRIIESWTRYIEKNPKDSLAKEGYLQVATGYYLLSRLTSEESDFLKGIELLEKYEKQITDPKTKEELDKKLEQIKALKQK